jgi:peptide/nickel transport system permease protein
MIVITFMIIGDLVPETINKVLSTPVVLGNFLSGVLISLVLAAIVMAVCAYVFSRMAHPPAQAMQTMGSFAAALLVVIAVNVAFTLPDIGTVKPDLGTPVPYLADRLEKSTGIIYPYAKQDLRARLQGPSSKHLLGTDSIGRDILSRLLYGARTAVMVSFGAVFISSVMQILISIPAGYYGGWYDKIMYRLVDVMDSLPGLVILITVLGIFGSGLWQMIFAIGVLGGFGGRTLRGQTIYLMASPFIEAARVIGASDRRIMYRYIIPNVFPLIILYSTLRLGSVVLQEASLSFLGYGLPPPFPSWGQMLSLEGREYMRTQPGLAIYPGLAIGLLVFSFNLFGDALRDVLDPRLRGSRR